MNVQPRSVTVFAKTFLLFLALLIVALFLIGGPVTGSVARGQGERVFENKVPKDLPFTIKIKKEKEESFKDLKNDNWLREFEVELTNTGDKPIYFFYLTMISDVNVTGEPLVFPLTYGRAELGNIVTKASPDDVPIKPGETYVLKVNSGSIEAWERAVKSQRFPQVARLKGILQALSFSDGTGYFGNESYPKGL